MRPTVDPATFFLDVYFHVVTTSSKSNCMSLWTYRCSSAFKRPSDIMLRWSDLTNPRAELARSTDTVVTGVTSSSFRTCKTFGNKSSCPETLFSERVFYRAGSFHLMQTGRCSTWSSKLEAPNRGVLPLANRLHRPEASQRAPVPHPFAFSGRSDAVLPQPLSWWQRTWSWALWEFEGGPEKAGRQSAANNPLGFRQGRWIVGFQLCLWHVQLVRSILTAQPLSLFSPYICACRHKLARTPSRPRSKCLEVSSWPNDFTTTSPRAR